MKLKRLLSLFIIVVMLLAVIPISANAGVNYGCDKWAEPEMRGANEKGLLTPSAAKNFKKALTRDEFCELVVIMSEELLGYELPVPASNPFTDSNSIYVQKAYSYGVVNGVGNNMFDPNGNIERQQIATMMIRALTQLEKDTGLSYLKAGGASLTCADKEKVDSYAVDYVKSAYANGIMQGDEANRFNPKANINSQECVAVIYRSYNSFDNQLHKNFSTDRLIEKAVTNLRIGYSFGESEYGVSSGIDLPTTGVGGTTVTWSSSNTSIISNVGIVKPLTYETSVILTATLRLGNQTRTKTFIVTVSPLASDRLQLENAIQLLDIYYCIKGDSVNRVTGRISLPSQSNGLAVKWSSSNESVVSTRGYVTPPNNDKAITVTLTATVTSGNQTKTKNFVLQVVNPSKVANLSLHGIALGASPSQVSGLLGSAKSTVTMSSTESWQVFHTNYSGFIAVGYVSNRVVAVYSMASNATTQFRNTDTNAYITFDQAKAYVGVGVKIFTDSNDSNRTYAVMLYDNNSDILSYRSLYADGTELLLADFVNAFRVQKGVAALTWNTKLASSARAHSTDMSRYNYFDRVGRDYSTYQIRAERTGYDRSLASEENIAANCIDATDFLNSWINAKTTSNRANLLNSSYTVAGIGYAAGQTNSTYKNYCTMDFGNLRAITNVTTNPTSAAVVEVNETKNIALTLTPSNYNETFTVHSSNTGVITATRTSATTPTVSVKGMSRGSANIVITGNSSGTVINIPVTVGITYATSMSLNHTNLLMGTSTTSQLVATTSPTNGPVVSWSSNDTSVATVNANGVVSTGTKTGSAVITAVVRKSANENITRTVTISVVSASITPASPPTMEIGKSSATLNLTPSVTPNISPTYTWSSSNANVASVSSSGVVTAKVSGSATIYCTVTRSNYTGSVVKSVNVTVTGRADYATDLTLSHSALTLEVNQKQKVTATTTPTTVTYGTVTWESLNPGIATVSNSGEITGVSAGTAKIKVSAPSGPNNAFFTREVTVTVKAITLGISIQPSTHQTITLGENIQFSAAVTPDYAPADMKQYTWYSSNEAVAVIDSHGRLASKAIGTTEIYAKINGQDITSERITVTVNAVSPVSINITSNTGDTVPENTTVQLSLNVNPSNASTAVSWTSSNENIATVDGNGFVTFKDITENATVTITATSIIAPAISGEYTFNVTAG